MDGGYWFAIGFVLGLIAMHEIWRWLHRKIDKLNAELIAEREQVVEWLLECSDDYPWTALDIANMIYAGCPEWSPAMRRDPAELEWLKSQSDHLKESPHG